LEEEKGENIDFIYYYNSVKLMLIDINI